MFKQTLTEEKKFLFYKFGSLILVILVFAWIAFDTFYSQQLSKDAEIRELKANDCKLVERIILNPTRDSPYKFLYKYDCKDGLARTSRFKRNGDESIFFNY